MAARLSPESNLESEGEFELLVNDMVELTLIAKQENPHEPFFLRGRSMGSFTSQLYVLDNSYSIHGLALSGSGALDGPAKLASANQEFNPNFLNARFAPARTPFDWLSRDPRVVDVFLNDPLCFGALKPTSTQSFSATSEILMDADAMAEIVRIYQFICIRGAKTRSDNNWRGSHPDGALPKGGRERCFRRLLRRWTARNAQ